MNNELRSKIELATDNWLRQKAALKALIEPGDLPAELSRELEREADMLRKCAEEIKRLIGVTKGRWTTQAPTEPGWYWFAPTEGPVVIVELERVMLSGEWRAYLTGDENYALNEMDGTWYSEALTVPGNNGEKS